MAEEEGSQASFDMGAKMIEQTEQEQIDQWSKLYDKQITEEEYKEICNNLCEFFKLLYEWNKEEKCQKA